MSPEQLKELTEEMHQEGYTGPIKAMYDDEPDDLYADHEITQIDTSHITPISTEIFFRDEDKDTVEYAGQQEVVYIVLEDGAEGFLTADGFLVNSQKK